jgi:hypothetical protein
MTLNIQQKILTYWTFPFNPMHPNDILLELHKDFPEVIDMHKPQTIIRLINKVIELYGNKDNIGGDNGLSKEV